MKNQYIFQGKELLHKLSYLLRVYTSQNLLFYTIYHYGQNLFNHKYFDPRVNIFDLPRLQSTTKNIFRHYIICGVFTLDRIR